MLLGWQRMTGVYHGNIGLWVCIIIASASTDMLVLQSTSSVQVKKTSENNHQCQWCVLMWMTDVKNCQIFFVSTPWYLIKDTLEWETHGIHIHNQLEASLVKCWIQYNDKSHWIFLRNGGRMFCGIWGWVSDYLMIMIKMHSRDQNQSKMQC